MVAVAGLSVLARLVGVPYPILLVLGGLVPGFMPGMPMVELPPELVLVAFLPPLLYWAGFFSSPRDLRADARAISLLAVGLVLATTVAVAVLAHAMVEGMTWPAAFALGAIVSAAYLPAGLLGVSGVLAAVTTGLYVGWRAPELASAPTRLLGFSFWEVLVYLANAVLFILVGLQLRPILEELAGTPVAVLVAQGAVVSAVVVAVRVGWGFSVPYLVRLLDRRPSQVMRRVEAKGRLLLGWSGMRGAVSLAAALALPLDFPLRNLILFLTFSVILVTLVVQGLTLPALIRRLRFEEDDSEEREEVRARLAAASAALDRLGELAGEDWTRD